MFTYQIPVALVVVDIFMVAPPRRDSSENSLGRHPQYQPHTLEVRTPGLFEKVDLRPKVVTVCNAKLSCLVHTSCHPVENITRLSKTEEKHAFIHHEITAIL